MPVWNRTDHPGWFCATLRDQEKNDIADFSFVALSQLDFQNYLSVYINEGKPSVLYLEIICFPV